MADGAITIKLDESALREQIHNAVREEIREFAMKLHWAADALDPAITEELIAGIRAEYEKK